MTKNQLVRLRMSHKTTHLSRLQRKRLVNNKKKFSIQEINSERPLFLKPCLKIFYRKQFIEISAQKMRIWTQTFREQYS